MNEDAELLRRFAETHAEEAFARLVQRHLGLVYHAALRRTNGDAHLAQDIAQQVFTTLAKEARILSRHAVLSGWLYVTTRHLAANAMRAEHRRKQREEVAHRLQDTPPNAPSAWDQLRPELDAVMEELSGPDRDAVLLRFFEDQSYAHIGATLDVSEDAARMRVDRALDKLRGLLAHRGIESTAAALGAVLAGHAAGAAPAGLATSVTGAALGSLTVAAASAATTGTLWTFMTTTKTLAGVAGAIACMGIGAGIYEASGFSSTEKEMAALNAQLAQANARLRAAEDSRTILQKQLSTPAPSTAGTSSNTTGPTSTIAAPVSTPPRGDNSTDIAFADPEFQRLTMEKFRADLSLTYRSFYRKAALSPDKVAALEAILIERNQIFIDTMAAAREQGLSVADAQKIKSVTDAYAAIDTQMRALLGAELHAQFQTYQRNTTARTSVGNLAASLYDTDAPLAASQADKLTEIFAKNTSWRRQPGSIGNVSHTNWDSVTKEAEAVLSAPQIKILQQVGQSAVLNREISSRMNLLTTEALQAKQREAKGSNQ